MNKNLSKGTGNPTETYKTGDVIWKKSSEASLLNKGWVTAGTKLPLNANKKLFKAMTNREYPVSVDWVSQNSNTTGIGYSIAYGNGKWVAAGNMTNTIRTSTDTVTWTTQTGPGTSISAVAYGGSLWVALGRSNARLYSSTDAVTWTMAAATSLDANYSNTAELLLYGNGTWVAADDEGSLVTSTNGTTWVNRSSPGGPTYSVGGGYWQGAYGNSVFLLGGGSVGLTRSSDNGVTWTQALSEYSYGLAFGNGVFGGVFSTSTGETTREFRTSTDGLTWTKKSNLSFPTWSGSSLFSNYLKFVNNYWVILSNAVGKVYLSTDGISWTEQISSAIPGVRDVAYGNGLWAAIGDTQPAAIVSSAGSASYSFISPNVPAPAGYTSWIKT